LARKGDHGGTAVAVANPSNVAKELAAITQSAESLRAHEEATEAARAMLTRRIYAAAEAGHSESVIATAAGVSRQHVQRLLSEKGKRGTF
jgi:cobalamin biosynthesis protein CbiG